MSKEKVKVYTQFDRPETIPSNAGDEYIDTYIECLDENGVKTIAPTGKTNVYAKIQEDLEDTLIENIIHKMMMGDFTMLKAQQGQYVDSTTMPKSLMDAQNIIIKAKAEFEKFPAEVRDLFDQSAEKYVSEMGTKAFFEKMSKYNDKIAEIEKAGNHKKYLDKVAEQAKFEQDVANAKGGKE